MKYLATLILPAALLVLPAAFAADPAPLQPSSAITVGGVVWETDFARAKEIAVEKKRPILALFTGSDWCPVCQKLSKEVLEKPAFKKFAETEVVPLFLDFPKHKELPLHLRKQNELLEMRYQVEGYPTTILLNPDGSGIGMLEGYDPDYVKILQRGLAAEKAKKK